MDKDIKIKYIEQKIGWYKLVLTLIFASAAGSLGWFVNHGDSVFLLRVLAIISFIVFALGTAVCVSRARHYIKLLGESK